MNFWLTIKTSLLFIVVTLAVINCKNIYELEKEILDQILDKSKYDNRIVPHNSTVNGATKVSTNIYIRSIEYVSTKDMEWKAQLTFRHQWNDPRLQFDDRQGQIRYLSSGDADRVWKPDTFISNSKKTEQHTDLKKNTLIRIYPNGNVLFSIRLTATLSCPMDLKHYPFDTQTCTIVFASYEYTTENIIYLWKEGDPVQITSVLFIPDMTLVKYATSDCTSRTNTGEYSCIKVSIEFERNSSKYVCRWLLPTGIITLIAFASFWIKPKKCSRVKLLAITLILLYLHIIYINNMEAPNISYSTAKDCWLSTCLIFVFMALLETGIVALINKMNKQRKCDSKVYQNGKTADPEGDAVILKPLVDGKEDSNQQTVNEQCSHNFAQKWRRSPISCRIDMISAILFPILFIVYVITFAIYQSLI